MQAGRDSVVLRVRAGLFIVVWGPREEYHGLPFAASLAASEATGAEASIPGIQMEYPLEVKTLLRPPVPTRREPSKKTTQTHMAVLHSHSCSERGSERVSWPNSARAPAVAGAPSAAQQLLCFPPLKTARPRAESGENQQRITTNDRLNPMHACASGASSTGSYHINAQRGPNTETKRHQQPFTDPSLCQGTHFWQSPGVQSLSILFLPC